MAPFGGGHHRTTGLIGVLFAAALLLTGCGAASTSGGQQPAGSRAAGRSAPPAPRLRSADGGGRKTRLTGLIDMGVQTPYLTDQPFPTTDPNMLDADAGAFAGIVVNEAWSELEPTPGREDWAPLDASLAAVQQWNDQHLRSPLEVKLRIFAGASAPAWVVAASGGPVTVDATVPVGPGRRQVVSREMGRWWTAPFRQAWSDFQHALAARYDGDPLIHAVSVSSCSSLTGEPFIVGTDPTTRANLAAAGWSVQAQEQCLEGALADYSGWQRTPVTFAFNPLATDPGTDEAFTDSIMQACAQSASEGGPDCVLENNDLSATVESERGPSQVYAEIDTLEADDAADPPAVTFQTVGAAASCPMLAVATAHHATSVELWPPHGHLAGFGSVPVGTLSAWNRALQAGQQITC
jgi:hypothetical protein